MVASALLFVVLCFEAGSSWSDAVSLVINGKQYISKENSRETVRLNNIPGLNEWCTADEKHVAYDLVNYDCCTEEYKCDWYIDAGESKDGLTNSGAYRRRTCDCDEQFYLCSITHRSPIVKKAIEAAMSAEKCLQKGNVGEKDTWVESATWLKLWRSY